MDFRERQRCCLTGKPEENDEFKTQRNFKQLLNQLLLIVPKEKSSMDKRERTK